MTVVAAPSVRINKRDTYLLGSTTQDPELQLRFRNFMEISELSCREEARCSCCCDPVELRSQVAQARMHACTHTRR